MAIKYTRTGKPRETKFKLSDDEQMLSWEGGHGGLTAPVKMVRGERRSIQITEILEVMLGMESKVFSLHKDRVGGADEIPMAHVSMTLVLVGSLPSLPMGEEEELGRTKTTFEMRESLDISFNDEEVFGLWVAALRALMYETQPAFFTKVASPINNVNQSAIASIRQKAPDDAWCGELLRDAILQAQLMKCSDVMNIVWVIIVAGCGTWWLSSLFGWWDWAYIIYDKPYPCENGKCSGYNATRDGPWYMEKIDWANFAIQMVRGLLTYQGLVMVGPWRFSNLWHLTCSRRESSKGHDFYGRQVGDDATWFQIDAPKRLKIILFLVGNIFFQCLLQVSACVYYSYELDQSLPGTLIGLSMMMLSIGCALSGAYWQTRYEQDLHLSDPDRFPPNPIFHAIDKFKEHREKKRARQSIHKEVEHMRSNRMSFIGEAGGSMYPACGDIGCVSSATPGAGDSILTGPGVQLPDNMSKSKARLLEDQRRSGDVGSTNSIKSAGALCTRI